MEYPVKYIEFSIGCPAVIDADEVVIVPPSPAFTVDAAERIVACLNATSFFDTAALESGESWMGITNKTIAQLKNQRDTLLAALENAVAWAEPMRQAPVNSCPKWFQESSALIASVKGGAE